jgi:hypothetical protein
MPRPKKTHLDRHRALFHAAAIAAHARFTKDGFRQKDLRFLIELFSNWLETSLEGSSLDVENTQIARYLSGLVEGGWAKQSGSTIPRYRLTRDGLVEQLSRLVDRPHWWPIEEYWFVVYFLDSYRERLNTLIVQAGPLYSGPMKLAVQQLLDVQRFSRRQEELLSMEIAKLDLRISDTRKTMALVRDGQTKGKSVEAILNEIQQKVPYQLNNQKPMHELFKETPDENWLWEMEIGSHNRAARMWMPLRDMLVHLRTQVHAAAHEKPR